MIHIVDYGMGNLRSVQKAFERHGVEATICDRPQELREAEAMVLPGVGAFRDAIAALKQHDLVGPIEEHIAADKPFLGICLGLQLLFDVSYEDGEYEGLGIVPGEVVRFKSQPGLRIPHMGWNEVRFLEAISQQPSANSVFQDIPEHSHFYFVHSYHVVPKDESVIACRTDHGGEFVSAIARGRMVATQFHPEKSQTYGLKLLENFAGQLTHS
ncbi:MAG: imidazole glycerol phosphate synthase subunit HisH [Planctomycetaceae bacterium]|nr:imidazole glycerol phosphate synthase subunit HisH [Planctomycetaceae bacterium]